jgi:hypothetical protein
MNGLVDGGETTTTTEMNPNRSGRVRGAAPVTMLVDILFFTFFLLALEKDPMNHL